MQKKSTISATIGILIWIAMLIVIAGNSGCRLYNFGNQGLHNSNIRSVHVSIIESDSYRKFLGQRLSESIVKQIGRDTHFQIASPEMADSFIRGRIIKDEKRALTETANDDVRDVQFGIQVEITWTDRNGMPLMDRQVLRITSADHFVPEGGQSMTTAQQEVINRVARQVVNQMEMPW